MSRLRRPAASALAGPLIALGLGALLGGVALRGDVALAEPLAEAVAAVEAAVRDYQQALGRLLDLQEKEAERAQVTAQRYRKLYEDGLVSRVEAEAAEGAAAEAHAKIEATQARIADGDRMFAEAQGLLALATLPPAPPGAERSTPWVVEYHGVAPWSLTQIGGLERFFAERFGRPLPVSALGQTALHDRLGFDHANSLDVAVHPDSAEGRALLQHLRALGVPYLAFREARAGVSTGAHVHIGPPSRRRG